MVAHFINSGTGDCEQTDDVVLFTLRSLSSDVAELSGAKGFGVKALDVPYRKTCISY